MLPVKDLFKNLNSPDLKIAEIGVYNLKPFNYLMYLLEQLPNVDTKNPAVWQSPLLFIEFPVFKNDFQIIPLSI